MKNNDCPFRNMCIDTDCEDCKAYNKIIQQRNKVKDLESEILQLRARLENAVELPTMSEFKIVDLHTNFYQISYAVLYKSKGKLYIYQCFDKAKAEAKLKEYNNGK